MDGVFGNLINALAEIWKSIGIAQKVSILLIAFITIMATGIIFYFGSRPDWQILYSNLDKKTASQVYDIAKDSGVEVKLTDSGRTIMVPSSEVYKLRLKVASEGVSVERTGVGLELFENMKLGATDREQQVAFQRAIQGELERMINEMPAVLSSKVLLTTPGKKVFRKQKENPSASVLLVVDGGQSLTARQVNSIRYMVSSAVSGMSPQNVTITDNRGNLLVRQVSEEEAVNGDSNRQMDICNRTEETLKQKAEAILRPIVGFENVVAMVSCEMDFNNVDKVTEKYDSENAVAIQEKTVTENNAKMNGGNNGGAAGVAANLASNVSVSNPTGGSGAGGPAQKMSEEQRKTTEKQFVVPKTVEKTTIKGGRVRKLTVAVTIAKKSDGASWTPQELANFEELVAAAVGVDNYFTPEELKKNPVVTVKEMPFIPIAKAEPPAVAITDKIMFELNKYSQSSLIRPILGFLLLIVLYRIFRKYFNKTSVEGADFGFGAVSPGAVYGEEVKKIETEEPQEPNERDQILDSLNQKSQASPQTVADILERWLASEQG